MLSMSIWPSHTQETGAELKSSPKPYFKNTGLKSLRDFKEISITVQN